MNRTTAALRAALVLALCAPMLAWADHPDHADGSDGHPPPRDDRPPATEADFTRRVLVSGLSDPFEMLYGPDGMLWVTERTAGRVTLVDPSSGATRTVLTIPDVVATEGEQDGLLGMAFSPDSATPGDGSDGAQVHDVYLSYTYDGDPAPDVLDRRQRIVRYSYDAQAQMLVRPATLIEGLIASDDHNSGRLAFGPDGKLYYTIGDRGNNQDLNACRPNLAQRLPTADEVRAGDWTAYQGKVLRMNPDGSIPEDNPVLAGVVSHVYSYGHRNAQGLVFAPGGQLYSSEQGPKSDDELNLIEAGRNYGWPRVAGYQDDSAYVFGDWSAQPGCNPDDYDAFDIPANVPQYTESSFHDPALTPPLRTFYTVPDSFDFRANVCAPSGLFFICYPTVAPSGLDIYTSNAIPGWQGSLLMPTLKTGALFRLPISDADGKVIDGPLPLWSSINRYRDTAIDPTGTTIFLSTDSSGLAKGADGTATSELENPGSILAFTYDGEVG